MRYLISLRTPINMNQTFTFEIIWWLITFVICLLFLFPIYAELGASYLFYLDNIIFIGLFITGFRFIFFTKYHWFASYNRVKLVYVFLSIPILMYLIGSLWDFQNYLDEYGMYSMMEDLQIDKQRSLSRYIKTEMIFTWIGATISFIILPFKMLRSIWILKNRNKLG